MPPTPASQGALGSSRSPGSAAAPSTLPSSLGAGREKLAIAYPISREAHALGMGCPVRLCPSAHTQPPAPLSAAPPRELASALKGCSCDLSYPSRQAVVCKWAGAALSCEINDLIPVLLCCVYCGASVPCPPTHRLPAATTFSLTVIFLLTHVAALSRGPRGRDTSSFLLGLPESGW